MTTEELRKSLFAEKKNGYTRITAEQKEEMNAYCKRYMAFMDACKTEREATAWAIAEKCDTIAYAAHGGDHTIYPDCRPEFAEKLDAVVQISDWHRVCLERPFVDMDKTEIVRLGARLNAPLELTWSCYNGGKTHCGKCSTCVERREAFRAAGIPDPTVYAE